MADDEDPVGPGGDPEPTMAEAPPPTAVAPVLKTRWRDRAWTFRSVIAVAVASVLIGGVAGGVIGAAAGGRDEHQRIGRWGPGGAMPPGWRGHGPRWGWNDGPNNGPGGPGGPGGGPGGPMMTPYGNGGGTTPQPPSPSPSSTG